MPFVNVKLIKGVSPRPEAGDHHQSNRDNGRDRRRVDAPGHMGHRRRGRERSLGHRRPLPSPPGCEGSPSRHRLNRGPLPANGVTLTDTLPAASGGGLVHRRPAGAGDDGHALGTRCPNSCGGAAALLDVLVDPLHPPVRVEVLGPLRISIGNDAGTAPDLRRNRVRTLIALFALLALIGPVRRERLADLMWPDLDAAPGARNLRVTLTVCATCSSPIVVPGARPLPCDSSTTQWPSPRPRSSRSICTNSGGISPRPTPPIVEAIRSPSARRCNTPANRGAADPSPTWITPPTSPTNLA